MSETSVHHDKQQQDESTQSYLDHLIELRDRLLSAIKGIALIFACLFFFREEIYLFVAQPLINHLPDGAQLISIRVQDNFLTPIRLVIWLSFYFTIPWTFYQLWRFIAPGLYKHERSVAVPLLLSSILLFYLGVLFAYYVVLPLAFGFLTNQQIPGSALQQDINQLISLTLLIFFAFGVAFEVPVAVVILAVLKVISTERIAASRPYIIIAAFVIGAIITPPDAISQILFASIVLILFEVGLWFARKIEGKERITINDPLIRTAFTLFGIAAIFATTRYFITDLYQLITPLLLPSLSSSTPPPKEAIPLLLLLLITMLISLPWILYNYSRALPTKGWSEKSYRYLQRLLLIELLSIPLIATLFYHYLLPPIEEYYIWPFATNGALPLTEVIRSIALDGLLLLGILSLPWILTLLVGYRILTLKQLHRIRMGVILLALLSFIPIYGSGGDLATHTVLVLLTLSLYESTLLLLRPLPLTAEES